MVWTGEFSVSIESVDRSEKGDGHPQGRRVSIDPFPSPSPVSVANQKQRASRPAPGPQEAAAAAECPDLEEVRSSISKIGASGLVRSFSIRAICFG